MEILEFSHTGELSNKSATFFTPGVSIPLIPSLLRCTNKPSSHNTHTHRVAWACVCQCDMCTVISCIYYTLLPNSTAHNPHVIQLNLHFRQSRQVYIRAMSLPLQSYFHGKSKFWRRLMNVVAKISLIWTDPKSN